MLFDHLKISGLLAEQAKELLNKTREMGIHWARCSIIRFLDFHKERVRCKELPPVRLKITIEHGRFYKYGFALHF